jgi:hypothetical protein
MCIKSVEIEKQNQLKLIVSQLPQDELFSLNMYFVSEFIKKAIDQNRFPVEKNEFYTEYLVYQQKKLDGLEPLKKNTFSFIVNLVLSQKELVLSIRNAPGKKQYLNFKKSDYFNLFSPYLE